MNKISNLSENTRKLIISLMLFMAIGAACGVVLREPLTLLASDVFSKFGKMGLVLGTLITDTSPLPLTSEPVAIIGIAAGLPIWQIIVIMGATSHLCGPLGYGCGKLLCKLPGVKDRLQHYQPELFEWVKQNGVKGVAVAAILPIPYALSTWVAGIVGISFWGVCKASSLRWVKTALYTGLFAGGWFLGA